MVGATVRAALLVGALSALQAPTIGQPTRTPVASPVQLQAQDPLAEAARLRRAGRYEDALRLCEGAADAARRADSRADEAAALQQAGLSARGIRGGLERAVTCWERAAELHSELGDESALALEFFYLGNAHGEAGRYLDALEALESAVERFHALEDPQRQGWALSSLGVLQERRGRLAEARGAFESALELTPDKDLATRGGLLSNLADVRGQLGEVEESFALAEAAMDLVRRAGDRLGIALAHGQLGLAHERAGTFDEGIPHLEQALETFRELGRVEQATVALDNLALLEMQAGRLEPALEHQREGLALALERGDPWLEGNAHFHLSRILQRLERPDEARASDERLAEIGQRLESPLLLMRAHLNAARRLLSRARNDEDLEAALQEARASIRWTRDVVGGLAPEDDARARDHCREAHEIALRCALALGAPAAVLEMIERGRAQALVASLGGQGSVEQLLSPTLGGEHERSQQLERDALLRWRAATERGDAPELVEAAHSALETARKTTRAAELRIRGGRSAEGLVYPEPVRLTDLQAGLRPAEARVLSARADPRPAALLVTNDSARLVELGPTAEIDRRCARLCGGAAGTRGVVAPEDALGTSPLEDALELRRLLLAPLQLSSRVQRLLVSPDGGLAYGPFALIAPELEVVHLPSASTLAVLRARPPSAGVDVLALGDPRYPPESGLAQLPGSRAEVQELGDVQLLGEAANEEALLGELGRERPWRAVHLACHARVASDKPLGSELFLSPSPRSDGRLTVLEVFGLPLRTELVVLSACETGVGKLYRSEGVFGFTRAFMSAGAPRVIVSLWRVDDLATRALMQRLYELWNPDRGRGLPLSTALEQARDYVRSQAAWSDPRFWAAWQLWGLPE